MKKPLIPISLVLAGISCANIVPTATATTLTWGSANTSGSWSVAGNWTPTTAAAPTTSDTATLGDASANRTVYYDTAASGTLNTLTINENSGSLNQLTLYRNLGVATAITLGAASGTSAIFLDTSLGSTGTSGATLSFTAPSITINSGGVLASIVSGTSNGYQPVINGNITLNSGGQFTLYRAYKNSTSIEYINGSIIMTGGTFSIGTPDGSYANTSDNRIQISGTANISGGTIVNGGGAGLRFETDGTIAINNVTFSGAAPATTLESAGNQSFTSNVSWAGATFCFQPNNATGNAIKSIGSSVVGGTLTVGAIQMAEKGSGTSTMQLTSDVVSLGSSQLIAQNGQGAGKAITLGIDTNGHTLDLTANTGATTPWALSGVSVSNSSNVIWLLTNSAGSGTTGKIRAQGFNFSVTTGSGISVGSYTTLESVGTSVANNLGAVAGTINPTSTFLYTGAGTTSSPATITSNRTIGRLEVGTGSSASYLKLTSAALNVGADVTVKASSVLDLGGLSLTESAVAGGTSGGLNGAGTIRNNTASTTATLTLDTTNGNGSFSGTIVDNSGAGGTVAVTKTGAGTQTLSGVNTYTGATTLSTGELDINGSLAAGSAVNVASGATLAGSGTVGGAVNASGTITGSLTFNNNVTINSGASAAASAFNGNIVDNGTITSAVNVQSGKVLSGTGAVTGITTVSGTTSAGNGNNTGVLKLDLSYNSGAVANFTVSGSSATSSPVASKSGLAYSQVEVTTNNLQLGAANQTVTGDVSNSGVTLALSMTATDFSTLAANATNAYMAYASNSTQANYFVFALDDGLTTSGKFQTLTINIDGTDYTGTIYYSGANDRFDGVSYLGDVYVNVNGTTQEFAISYTGNASSNSTIGGNDIVITAVPEPSTWAMIVGGVGMLVMTRRTIRRKA